MTRAAKDWVILVSLPDAVHDYFALSHSSLQIGWSNREVLKGSAEIDSLAQSCLPPHRCGGLFKGDN